MLSGKTDYVFIIANNSCILTIFHPSSSGWSLTREPMTNAFYSITDQNETKIKKEKRKMKK